MNINVNNLSMLCECVSIFFSNQIKLFLLLLQQKFVALCIIERKTMWYTESMHKNRHFKYVLITLSGLIWIMHVLTAVQMSPTNYSSNILQLIRWTSIHQTLWTNTCLHKYAKNMLQCHYSNTWGRAWGKITVKMFYS